MPAPGRLTGTVDAGVTPGVVIGLGVLSVSGVFGVVGTAVCGNRTFCSARFAESEEDRSSRVATMSLEKPPMVVAPNRPFAASTTSPGSVTPRSTGMAGASRPALAAGGSVAVMFTGMSRAPRLGNVQV